MLETASWASFVIQFQVKKNNNNLDVFCLGEVWSVLPRQISVKSLSTCFSFPNHQRSKSKTRVCIAESMHLMRLEFHLHLDH